jgi:hypothetical protein
MGPLSQPAAEGDVLACRLVERDQEIIRIDGAADTTASFKAFSSPSLFSLGRPKMNVISNTIRSSE